MKKSNRWYEKIENKNEENKTKGKTVLAYRKQLKGWCSKSENVQRTKAKIKLRKRRQKIWKTIL